MYYDPGEYRPPFGWFFYNHRWLLFLIHFVGFTIIVETGADYLEPAAINWFWSPFIALLCYPRFIEWPSTKFGLWMHDHARLLLWVNWAIGALLTPYLIWPGLKQFDVMVAHPLRDGLGRALGLRGQTGLLVAICVIVGIITLVDEVCLVKYPERKWKKE